MRVWLVTAVLLAMTLSPVLNPPAEYEDSAVVHRSNPLQVTLSSTSGWTTGGEEITISGTGFSDLAFSNVSNDGLNHQWAASNLDMSDQAGRWNAVGVDSNGHIHVVQIKDGNYEIRHSVHDGTGWNSVKINDCGNTYCWDIHMVIDGNDDLHLAYTTYTSWVETLVYMNYDGTAWTDQTVSSSAHFGPVGIAIDSNNRPHISYALNGADQCGNGLRLASYTGTGWSHSNVDSGSNRGCESAIVIDESDNIYIAYQDRSASKLKIATDKSGSWDSYLVDTGSSPSQLYPGYMTSMAMDDSGQFHIAHFDEKDDDLRYSTGTPNSGWNTEILDSSGHTGRDPSIAVDAANLPHIVYHTWSGQNLKYATYDPGISDWKISTIANNGDVGEGNSMFIDGNGVMHVPFNDATTDVLRYATKSTGVVVSNEITVEFGQLGAVTGAVVNDTTIRMTTPSVVSAGTVSLTLVDKDGNEHTLAPSFEFIDQNDLDGDGVANADDDCPDDAGTSNQDQVGCPDDDGDGYSNAGDAFPNDANEWVDSDSDGVGDNADAFPNDASETLDSDGDGVGDNADAFPNNGFEQYDSDGDGIGDNSDAFPNDASETHDTDGDGVGDNADAFPLNAFEQLDSDGDGMGDNSDAFPNDASETHDTDGDGVGDNADAFPNDASETTDSDGDGVGDNTDVFPNDANESADGDGDGVGDNADQCPDSEAGAVVDENGCQVVTDSDGDGVIDADDRCPNENASEADEDGDGCLDDDDGDGVLNDDDDCPFTDPDETVNANGCSEGQLSVLDTDNDGVSNLDDRCPETPADVSVDATGCALDGGGDEEVSSSLLESFFSGEADAVTTTVGVGAILIALFGLLQTNAVAALLPETFRWVQVLRNNTKLTKEEENELAYLQSLTQAYHTNPPELAEELEQLRGDLTARYTNNEIKKQTREKLMTLIDDLLASTPDQLKRIAHNDAYFGLAGAIDTEDRTQLLNEKLAMAATEGGGPVASAAPPASMATEPAVTATGTVKDDGYEWLEWPVGSGDWYYRTAHSRAAWTKWQ